jgi:outer membrane protein insertion porin family
VLTSNLARGAVPRFHDGVWRACPRGVVRVALVLVTLLAAGASPASATDTIGAIEINGNRTVSAEAIRARLSVAVNTPYDARQLDVSLQALFATGWFSDVRFDQRGTTLVVTVVERPIIAKIDFEGYAAIERSKLEPLVHLKAGARYTPAQAHADALRISNHYRSQGRLLTTVDPKLKTRDDGRVDVVFTIKEGAVTKVDHIVFVGNHAFSERQLRDVISTSQSGWFDVLKAAAFYDPERIEQDRGLLRLHYLKNGFPDARVLSAEATKNTNGTGYSVQFRIEEGERYVFSGAEIKTGVKLAKVEPGELERAIQVKAGSPYNQEQMDKSVEKMSLVLSDRGYTFMQVRPVPIRDAPSHTIAVSFNIEEGAHIYLERIDIVGNAKTRDYVIRRELRIAEGDAVNAFLLDRAKKRVQALGFFKSVTLKRIIGSAPDRIILTIEVVEDDTKSVSLGIGYSQTYGIVGDTALTERNLFGTGDKLSVKFTGGATTLQAELGFTEPHLLDSNFAAGFDLFYKNLDFTTQASYMTQRIGGDVRIGYPITDEWTGSVNYTLSRDTIYNVGSAASVVIKDSIPGYPNSTSATYWTSSVGYSLTYDGRDDKKHPKSGIYYTMSQDLAGLGGDVNYIRTVADLRGYYPVTDNITLMGVAQGGIISGWGGQDVPLLDMFYKGGETVRGFASAGIGPRDTVSANQDALGGSMYFKTSAELLFPIPGVPNDIGLRGEVFTDVGSLWGTTKTVAATPGVQGSSFAPRASVGVGLLWESPIGNLEAGYAIPVIKQSYDKTQPLYFGLVPF